MTASGLPAAALLAIANRLDRVLLVGQIDDELTAFARLVHAAGPHADGRFIGIDASARPPILLECEIWSHERGAFRHAVARRPGRLELAHDGTLFLANVGELDAATQERLLRTLDERAAIPIGGDNPYKVTARLIASTRDDLSGAVRDGRFRQDLFERLASTVITLPPATPQF